MVVSIVVLALPWDMLKMGLDKSIDSEKGNETWLVIGK